MLRNIFTIMLLGLSSVVMAQNSRIESASPSRALASGSALVEYWIDHDIDGRKQTAMSGSEANMSLDMSALQEGVHTLTYRVRNPSGLYSVPYMQYFLKMPKDADTEITIKEFQYWVDSFASQKTMAASAGTTSLNLDVNHLPLGVHVIYYRFKNSRGLWSPVESQYFVKVEPKVENLIVAYRYWFNDASADMRTVQLSTPQTPYTLQTNIKPFHLVKESELTDENRTTIKGADGVERIAAINTLHIMFRDSHGKWSEQQIDTFAAPLAKDADMVGLVENVRLLSLDNSSDWNNLGKPVGINMSASYSHEGSLPANIYYIIDDGATRLLKQDVASGTDFNARMECVFSDKVLDHTVKLFAVDSNEAATDTVVFGITDMRNTSLSGVPGTMAYTGKPLTIDGLTVKSNYTGEVLSTDEYSVIYINNVDDGTATVYAQGKFPNYIGKSYESHFTIESYVSDADLALLRKFYSDSRGAEEWNNKWDKIANSPVKLNELYGVRGNNGSVTEINLSGNNMQGDLSSLLRLPQLQRLDVASNKFEGTLDLTDVSPKLTYLNVRHNKIANIKSDIPASLTDCYLDYQDINEIVDFRNVQQDIEGFLDAVPNIALFNSSKHRLDRDSFRGYLYTCRNGKRGEHFMSFSIRDGKPYVDTYRDFYGSKGDSLVWETGCGTNFYVRYYFDDGDANMDCRVDVNDLVTVRNRILEWNSYGMNVTAANLWKNDDIINVQDAVCLVNILLNSTPMSVSYRGAASKMRGISESGIMGGYAEDDMPAAVLTIEGGRLMLSSVEPVAAFDIVINESQAALCQSLLASSGFAVSIRQQGCDTHIVGYSLAGHTLPAGVVEIAKIDSDSNTYVKAAQLSSSDAKSIGVVSDSADGIEQKGVFESEDAVYNAAGIRTNGMTRGLNIIKNNGTVRKVYKK